MKIGKHSIVERIKTIATFAKDKLVKRCVRKTSRQYNDEILKLKEENEELRSKVKTYKDTINKFYKYKVNNTIDNKPVNPTICQDIILTPLSLYHELGSLMDSHKYVDNLIESLGYTSDGCKFILMIPMILPSKDSLKCTNINDKNRLTIGKTISGFFNICVTINSNIKETLINDLEPWGYCERKYWYICHRATLTPELDNSEFVDGAKLMTECFGNMFELLDVDNYRFDFYVRHSVKTCAVRLLLSYKVRSTSFPEIKYLHLEYTIDSYLPMFLNSKLQPKDVSSFSLKFTDEYEIPVDSELADEIQREYTIEEINEMIKNINKNQ